MQRITVTKIVFSKGFFCDGTRNNSLIMQIEWQSCECGVTFTILHEAAALNSCLLKYNYHIASSMSSYFILLTNVIPPLHIRACIICTCTADLTISQICTDSVFDTCMYHVHVHVHVQCPPSVIRALSVSRRLRHRWHLYNMWRLPTA